MKKWARWKYQPVLPLGRNDKRITGSKEHINLSRKVAAEGIVLLKNEGKELPLYLGRKIALFGKASADYVKGGGGSGDVTVAWVKNLIDGLEEKEREGKVALFPELNKFYRENVKQQYANGILPGQTEEPRIPERLLYSARAFTDTAVISICRYSREGWDRSKEDYYLTEQEREMIDTVKKTFPHIIVILNVGSVVDTSWFYKDNNIQAAVLSWQAGMTGGLAVADILCGDEVPSGKLSDTFASSFEDYPFEKEFHESDDYVVYKEDIYVGYRYFETIPNMGKKVNYCFGHGLSYTEFIIQTLKVQENKEEVQFDILVNNVGHYVGKEVVQIYISAPQGKLGKPFRELKTFSKTRKLLPGEGQYLRLKISKKSMASYDDIGKVCKSAWILEKGEYRFYVGNSVRDTRDAAFCMKLEENVIIEQLAEKCIPKQMDERLTASGEMESMKFRIHEPVTSDTSICKEALKEPIQYSKERDVQFDFMEVAQGELSLENFMDSLSEYELVELLKGQPNLGVADTSGIGNLPEIGIPNIMTADGPAGLRIKEDRGVYTTAWPCATLLACTFNPDLVEDVGRAGGYEVKENNIGIWLTPAINIHRNPFCGRNFEYYSEDPVLTGIMGAAMVKGIQSTHISACVKHFACNNKETNRANSDSCLSERALREIYLKGFEIIVKEADPWIIMTSYNIVNGCRTSESRELLTDILREEWGFKGLVISDWNNNSLHVNEVLAGNDVKMPVGYPEELLTAFKEGKLARKDLISCAKRVLSMILKLD